VVHDPLASQHVVASLAAHVAPAQFVVVAAEIATCVVELHVYVLHFAFASQQVLMSVPFSFARLQVAPAQYADDWVDLFT
jgi:hypothetical protein